LSDAYRALHEVYTKTLTDNDGYHFGKLWWFFFFFFFNLLNLIHYTENAKSVLADLLADGKTDVTTEEQGPAVPVAALSEDKDEDQAALIAEQKRKHELAQAAAASDAERKRRESEASHASLRSGEQGERSGQAAATPASQE
jgi:hypothetical protein